MTKKILLLMCMALFVISRAHSSEFFLTGFEDSKGDHWKIYSDLITVLDPVNAAEDVAVGYPGNILTWTKNDVPTEPSPEARLLASRARALRWDIFPQYLGTIPTAEFVDGFYKYKCQLLDIPCQYAFPLVGGSEFDDASTRQGVYEEIIENIVAQRYVSKEESTSYVDSLGNFIVTTPMPILLKNALETADGGYEGLVTEDAFFGQLLDSGVPGVNLVDGVKASLDLLAEATPSIEDTPDFKALNGAIDYFSIVKLGTSAVDTAVRKIALRQMISESARYYHIAQFLRAWADNINSRPSTVDPAIVAALLSIAETYEQGGDSIQEIGFAVLEDLFINNVGAWTSIIETAALPLQTVLWIGKRFSWSKLTNLTQADEIILGNAMGLIITAMEIRNSAQDIYFKAIGAYSLNRSLATFAADSGIYELDFINADELNEVVSYHALNNKFYAFHSEFATSLRAAFYVNILKRVRPDAETMVSAGVGLTVSAVSFASSKDPAKGISSLISTLQLGTELGKFFSGFLFGNGPDIDAAAEILDDIYNRWPARDLEVYLLDSAVRELPNSNYQADFSGLDVVLSTSSATITGTLSLNDFDIGNTPILMTNSVGTQTIIDYSGSNGAYNFGVTVPREQNDATYSFTFESEASASAMVSIPGMGAQTEPPSASDLIFTEVNANRLDELVVISGFIKDNAGENIRGSITVEVEGVDYTGDVINTFNQKGSSFTFSIPTPFFDEVSLLRATSTRGLEGTAAVQIPGEQGQERGDIVITFVTPVVATEWPQGLYKEIFFDTQGLTPDERVVFEVVSLLSGEVLRTDRRASDKEEELIRMPFDATLGLARIRAYPESHHEFVFYSNPFVITDSNSPPVFTVPDQVAISGKASLFPVFAFDVNEDTLSFSVESVSVDGSSAEIIGDGLVYQSAEDYIGVDIVTLAVTDGVDTVFQTVLITVVDGLAQGDFESISSYQGAVSEIMDIARLGEHIFVARDDRTLLKFSLEGELVDEEVLPDNPVVLVAAKGKLLMVDDSARPDLYVFDEMMNLVDDAFDVGLDNVEDAVVAPNGLVYMLFDLTNSGDEVIQIIDIDDLSNIVRFSDDHDADRDLNAIAYVGAIYRGRLATVIVGGDDEDIYFYDELSPGSPQGDDFFRENDPQNDIHSLSSLAGYILSAGERGELMLFSADNGGYPSRFAPFGWSDSSAHDGTLIEATALAGSDAYSGGADGFVDVRALSSGLIEQRLPLGSKVKELFADSGVLVAGTVEGKVEFFTRPPVFFLPDTTISTNSNTAKEFLLSGVEESDAQLSESVEPLNGNVVIDGAFITYTPDTNFIGYDQFIVLVDQKGQQAEVTVFVSVLNQAPRVKLELTEPADVYSIDTAYSMAINIVEPEGQLVSEPLLRVIAQPSSANAVVTNEDGEAKFSTDTAGVYTVQVNVEDDQGMSAKDNVQISITNVPPDALSIVTTLNTGVASIITLEPSDPNITDTLSVSVLSVVGEVASASFNGLDLTIVPSDLEGEGQVRVQVSDEHGLVNEIVIALTVVNEAPLTIPVRTAIASDTTVEGTLNIVDPENDPITVSITTASFTGEFTLTNDATGDYTYVPRVDGGYTELIRYSVSDGRNPVEEGELQINVLDAPSPGEEIDSEPPVISMVNNSLNVDLAEGRSVSVNDTKISAFLDSVVAVDNIDGIVNVTHDALSVFNLGTTSVSFSATDSAGNVSYATASIIVTSGDIDSDGVSNEIDNCPEISNPNQHNFDLDEYGDACDNDIDGDGVVNSADVFPMDSNESIDTDSDGIGNNQDIDDDNDGLSDSKESQLNTDPLNSDTDGDGKTDYEEYSSGGDPLTFEQCPGPLCSMTQKGWFKAIDSRHQVDK